MAMFHTDVLDNQIKALPTIDTASGSVATFTTDKAENLVECEVQIVAVQSGSGTPSPTNPRSISGFSACNLSHSDADTSNPTVYNIPFGQTIYGGVLNVGSGIKGLTHTDYDLGNLGWSYNSTYQVFYANMPSNSDTAISGGITGCICEEYALFNGSFLDLPNYSMTINNTTFSPSKRIAIKNTDYTDTTAFTSAVTGVKLVYKLETVQYSQLSATEIQTIANSENNIWSDTGDIEVKFVLSVGSYVNQNV